MATRALPARLTGERRFYFWMSAAMLATIFIGFAPSYYLRAVLPAATPHAPMSGLVMVHGALFTGWVLLFMAQVSLVSTGRVDLHRRLGVTALGMVIAMALVGFSSGVLQIGRGTSPPGMSPLAWSAVPIIDVPIFTGMILAALWFRKQPQVHKRLMLVAMIGMLTPATGRLPWPVGTPPALQLIGGMLPFFAALFVWDWRSRGKLHWATVTGTAIELGSWIFRLAIWETATWLSLAGWLCATFSGQGS
jgi:hypothetical protein